MDVRGKSEEDISIMRFISRSKNAFRLTFLVFVTLRLGAQQSDKALQLRDNVVKVLAGSENAENGFGFIVSERDAHVYIVTAYHILQPANTPETKLPRVRVIFHADPSTPHNADVLEHSIDHDIALIRVAVPSGLQWNRQCVAPSEEAKRGTLVWYIGRDGEWYVPALNGAINSERPDANWWLKADMPGLSPGSSGAPLVTASGIIAMVKAGSASDSRALSIEFIKRTVQDWGYQWDLLAPNMDLEKLFAQGKQFYEAGSYAKAVSVLTECISARSKWADAYNLRGAAYDKLGELQSAFADYDQAVSLSPTWSSPIFYRGRIFEQRGDVSAAAKDYDRAIQLSPDWSSPYYSRAVIFEKQNQPRDAYVYYAKACSLSPDWRDPCLSRDRLQKVKP